MARSPLVASALVIGSMSPDIPHFLPVFVGSEATDSPVGVVSIDVLLSLAIFVAWHGFLTRPAIDCAPAALRGRLPSQAVHPLRTRLSSPRRVLLVLVSVSLGAATHVVWDSFTHAGGWGTARVAWLAEQHGLLSGYGWAQYGSGVFGALVTAVWLARWWRRTPAAPSVSRLRPVVAASAWLSVLAAGAAGATLGSLGPLTSPGDHDLDSAAFLAATSGIALAALFAVLLAASWHLVTRPQAAGGEAVQEPMWRSAAD
jgi:Domain of unknown function (DUF4184)